MSHFIDEIKKEALLKDLKSLGLKEKEAAVYLALLSLGTVGSSKIIEATNLHGQFVYTALASLEEKGLVQHIIRNGRKKFTAKSPETLVNFIEQQKNKAHDLSSKLKEIILLPPEQHFETYQGDESYIANEFKLLKEAPTKSELLVIGGTGDQFLKTMGKEINAYERLRIDKKISVRYIGSIGQSEALRKTALNRDLFSYQLLLGLFTGMVNTNIWTTAIGFNVYSNPVTSFVIENPVIAGSYRQFFETLWNIGKKHAL